MTRPVRRMLASPSGHNLTHVYVTNVGWFQWSAFHHAYFPLGTAARGPLTHVQSHHVDYTKDRHEISL